MLIDSWAWVEMFKESSKGIRIRKLIENFPLSVSALTLAEIADWCVRNSKDPASYLNAIKENASILIVDPETAEKAGRSLNSLRKLSSGIGMVDAILYSQAVAVQMPFLTGDPHFKEFDNVLFIE